ncbi:hypothetical protein H0H92_000215, partial [Tricholoma furcatifolium]
VSIALEREGLSVPSQIDSLPSAPATLAAEFDLSFENPALLEPGPLPSEQRWIESQSPPVEGNLLLNSGSITNSMGSLSARGRSQNPAAHSIPLGSPLSSTPPLPPIVTIQEEQNNSSRLPSPASASTSEPAPPPVSTYTGPISWPHPNSNMPLFADQGWEWRDGDYTIG